MKKLFLLTLATIITTGSLSADECVDDATGAYAMFGGCATVLTSFGIGCDYGYFAVANIAEECPVSCDACPADCDANGPTSHGCCLPDLNLYLGQNGKVMYNSSEDIGGFQFRVEGATPTGVWGGDAGDANYTVQSNSETGLVLGFSLSGTIIPAGCGTLVQLDLSGTPTHLSDIIFTDPEGSELFNEQSSGMSYYEEDSTPEDSTPDEFVYAQSNQQAFYFIATVTIDGSNIGAEDWVGAFKGDVCVGSRKWDTSLCGGGICDVPIMGDDGSDGTDGYMLGGDIPSFKIYDASADTYLNAVASASIAWSNGDYPSLDNLSNHISGCTDAGACNFDANANSDDGSCINIVDGECDCDGNVADECGVCGGDNSSCADCAGVPNGGAEYAEYWTDDDGDGLGSGGEVTWEVILEPNDNKYCSTENRVSIGNTDSNGDPYTEESCKAYCINEPECVYAVFQEPPDNGQCHWQITCNNLINRNGHVWTWEIDRGEGSTTFCDATVSSGWADNTDDEDDNCFSNEYDCSGTCGGSAVADCAGTCNGTAVADCAGTCNGTAVADCAGTCNGSATVDCAGTCGGSATVDCAGVCDGSSAVDCAGACGGSSALDECGVCDGDGTSCDAPTWRLKLSVSLDVYNVGNSFVIDDENHLGVAVGGSWLYDDLHDIPEPPPSMGNYVQLFFDHPEWDLWTTHFTEDIVKDDTSFFSTNLTQWDARVESNVPGNTIVTFSVDPNGDPIPTNYQMYALLDGEYTRIAHDTTSTISFYMDGSMQKDFSVFIGNIVPQAPANLAATPSTAAIGLAWNADGTTDLSEISNRYPATSYNVYRDDQPADPDGNKGVYAPGDGPDGCGGLLTGSSGQSGSSYNDAADIYSAYSGEGLLQESRYCYTVTGSNLAGESSYGHTVRTSGNIETYHDGRDSRICDTTLANKDPYVNFTYVESSGDDYDKATNEAGLYRIPHNHDIDANKINISIDGSLSDDDDYPYSIDNHKWTLVSSNNGAGGLAAIADYAGTTTDSVSFTVSNPHENGQAYYEWQLYVDTSHPVRTDADSIDYNTCNGAWTSAPHMHSDSSTVTVTIDEEPNADPVASSALNLIRGGNGTSVLTSDDYDGPYNSGTNDFNDYDSSDQIWWEPHDNDGADNPADLYFSADLSSDADGACASSGQGACDHQTYSWSLTTGALAQFDYDDLNGNGQYNEGEPCWFEGGDEIYESADLGDHYATGPAAVPFEGTCTGCTGGVYISTSGPVNEDGSYNYGGRDLHFQREDDIYILSMTVTDEYGDSDGTSLVIGVADERNAAPTAADHRLQPDWVIAYGDNNRIVTVDSSCDNLGADDSDNDDLDFTWIYSGDDNTDHLGASFDSDYDHSQGASPSGWLTATADLGLGSHRFTFVVEDSYGATDTAHTDFTIVNEPAAVSGNIAIAHTALKHAIVHVSENKLDDFEVDCHGEVYNGADWNTGRLDLYRDSGTDGSGSRELIKSWSDADGLDTGNLEWIDVTLSAETDISYTLEAFNSDLAAAAGQASASTSGAATRTHDRPEVDVLTPNGAEIRSIGDNYDVDIVTYFDINDNDKYDEGVDDLTAGKYISSIDVIYLADGSFEEEGVNSGGTAQSSYNSTGPGGNGYNTAGCSQAGTTYSDATCHDGDATLNYEISDNDGLQINYDAKVRVRVTDVGDYNGSTRQTHEDDSDNPFTMAAHTIHKTYASGWHLIGPVMTPTNSDLETSFGSMGQWGQNWVAYNVNSQYDNLTLTLGEGYYLANLTGGDLTLSLAGAPVIADPDDCNDCADSSFALANISLKKGWNLVANPLVNKVHRDMLKVNAGGADLAFEDAVDDYLIQQTIFGWFENSYTAIDRLMPFNGYWINTSQDLTLKVRPHLFEDGELTRKADDIAWKMELEARDISGDGNSDFISIGLADNADNEFKWGEDEYDLPRQAYTAMGGEYIDMKIGSDLVRDIRSLEYEDFHAWNINVDHEKVDNDIELSWGSISGLEDDIHMVINGETVDMHEDTAIEISSTISEVTIVVGNVDSYLNPVPSTFGLAAAYPNPFNPVTNLKLALDTEAMVNMSVYNVRGQVVEVLLDRNMKAGYHNVSWNADGVSSGMYFVKVESGANTAMQKLMLLK